MAIPAIQNNPGLHAEAVPIEHVNERTSAAYAQAVVRFLGKVSFKAGCVYHSLNAPFLFIPSVVLGVLFSSYHNRNLIAQEEINHSMCIDMILSVLTQVFPTHPRYNLVDIIMNVCPGFHAGDILYQSFDQDSTFRMEVDIIADDLIPNLGLVIEKISQIQVFYFESFFPSL